MSADTLWATQTQSDPRQLYVTTAHAVSLLKAHSSSSDFHKMLSTESSCFHCKATQFALGGQSHGLSNRTFTYYSHNSNIFQTTDTFFMPIVLKPLSIMKRSWQHLSITYTSSTAAKSFLVKSIICLQVNKKMAFCLHFTNSCKHSAKPTAIRCALTTQESLEILHIFVLWKSKGLGNLLSVCTSQPDIIPRKIPSNLILIHTIICGRPHATLRDLYTLIVVKISV